MISLDLRNNLDIFAASAIMTKSKKSKPSSSADSTSSSCAKSDKTSKMSSQAPEQTMLSIEFQPTPYSVIIGRGRSFHDAPGNKRLRGIATSFLQDYTNATTKQDKTVIVSRIVDMVRVACPKDAAFIKLVNGRWWSLNDFRAREKVGYVLRDLLHDKYRSSSKAKVAKRRVQRQERKQAAATAAAAAASSNLSSSAQFTAEVSASGVNQALHQLLAQPQMDLAGNTNSVTVSSNQWIQPPLEVASSNAAVAALMGFGGGTDTATGRLSNAQGQPQQNQRALPSLSRFDYLTRYENITNESIAGLTSGTNSLMLPLPDMMVNPSPRLAAVPSPGNTNVSTIPTNPDRALDHYMMSLMTNNQNRLSSASTTGSSALAIMEQGQKLHSGEISNGISPYYQQQLDNLKGKSKKEISSANSGMKNWNTSISSAQQQKLAQQMQHHQQQGRDLPDDMRALFES